ncbi:carbohydrate sulfotransferase 1-like [Arapaima gigas]
MKMTCSYMKYRYIRKDTEVNKGPGIDLEKGPDTELDKGPETVMDMEPDVDMHKTRAAGLDKEPNTDLEKNPESDLSISKHPDPNVDMKADTDVNKRPQVNLDMKEDTVLVNRSDTDVNKQLDRELDMKSGTNLHNKPNANLDMNSDTAQRNGDKKKMDNGPEVQVNKAADSNLKMGQGKDLNMRPKSNMTATSYQNKNNAQNTEIKSFKEKIATNPNPNQLISKKTHILIFATMRSGSSFLGQVFSHHPDVFYLFEPLYHAEQSSIKNAEKHAEILKNLFSCNLNSLEPYIIPRPKNHITWSLFRRGASKAMCSPPVCNLYHPSKLGTEEKDCIQKCPSLNLTLAAKACSQRQHVVIKTVRISDINAIRTLVEDPKLNVKVIQLVRDPRGILCSRIRTFGFNGNLWNMWRESGQKPKSLNMGPMKEICNNFFSSTNTALKQPSWLKGRYMLVRYEDLALDPIHWAQKLLSYTGISQDNRVFSWLQSTINGGNKVLTNKAFGTVRNSAAEAEDWRLKLPYVVTTYTQDLCRQTLEQLGYKTVSSREELTNMSLSLVQDKQFLP